MEGKYIKLGELEVYRKAVKLSDIGWAIYEKLNWQDKKIFGDQFIRATNSCAANIAEGYGRYHYLDRIKFYYNGRASLLESKHWFFIMRRRNKVTQEELTKFLKEADSVHLQLNIYIKSCYKNKQK